MSKLRLLVVLLVIVPVGAGNSCDGPPSCPVTVPNETLIGSVGETMDITFTYEVSSNSDQALCDEKLGAEKIFRPIFRTTPDNSALEDSDLITSEDGVSMVCDVPGTYEVYTRVLYDENKIVSETTTTVTCAFANEVIAYCGQDWTGILGETATFDATESATTEGTTPQYTWSVLSAPAESTITEFTNGDSATPSFMPDALGTFVLGLTISNGAGSEDTCEVSATVLPLGVPEINGIGADTCDDGVFSLLGEVLDDATVTGYEWTLVDSPRLSNVEQDSFSDPTAANPTFAPDVDGIYEFGLSVFRDGFGSEVATIELEADEGLKPPVVVAGTSVTKDGEAYCGFSDLGEVICDACDFNSMMLTGSVTDPDDNTLTYRWISDDAGVMFIDASALETTVYFPAVTAGGVDITATRVFDVRLEASDCSGDVVTDTVSLTVNCKGTDSLPTL